MEKQWARLLVVSRRAIIRRVPHVRTTGTPTAEDELDDLPPIDGEELEEETLEAEDLDEEPADGGDPMDDSTGEGDPLEEIEVAGLGIRVARRRRGVGGARRRHARDLRRGGREPDAARGRRGGGR